MRSRFAQSGNRFPELGNFPVRPSRLASAGRHTGRGSKPFDHSHFRRCGGAPRRLVSALM
jgi:hypothetical protein